jgi:hypothetical protein
MVIVYVRNKYGKLVKCRALLDPASQGHLVTIPSSAASFEKI